MTTTAAPTKTTARRIDEFMAQNRLAVIGVSKKGQSFSRRLFTDLRKRGYNPVPVNPTAAEIEGLHCWANIGQVTPAVEGAIVIVPPQALDPVLTECAAAGVPRVWVPLPRKGAGLAGVALCRSKGIEVIYGFCPYMFLKDVGWFHRFHGFLEKRGRAYQS